MDSSMFSKKYLIPFFVLFTLAQVLIVNPGSSLAGVRNATIALVVDPLSGTLFKATADSLYQSQDAGYQWQSVALPKTFEDSDYISSIIIPAGGGTLYIAGAQKGVYRTTDIGKNWEPVMKGLPVLKSVSLTAHSVLPKTLYAIVSEKTIYRSQDAGDSWQMMDEGPDKIGLMIHTNMKGSMKTGWLFVATPQGIQRAMDCFCMWRQAGDLTGKINDLTYDPKNPSHIYTISEGQLFISRDGGEIWKQIKSIVSDLAAITFMPSGLLVAATVDGILFQSKDDAFTWVRVHA